jgi:DNA polymerase-3 subunit chi
MSKLSVQFINLAKAGVSGETAAARLAQWHYQAGHRVLILAEDQAQAQYLDRVLWTYDPASFLPHGVAGQPDSQDEPVLITTSLEGAPPAQVLILAHPLEIASPGDFRLIVDFVPADQGPALQAARDRYREWQQNPQAELSHLTQLPS